MKMPKRYPQSRDCLRICGSAQRDRWAVHDHRTDTIRILLKKELYSYSVADGSTASRELLWMGDGFLQLYKRLAASSVLPRTSEEVADLTEEQFRYLMMGLNP